MSEKYDEREQKMKENLDNIIKDIRKYEKELVIINLKLESLKNKKGIFIAKERLEYKMMQKINMIAIEKFKDLKVRMEKLIIESQNNPCRLTFEELLQQYRDLK